MSDIDDDDVILTRDFAAALVDVLARCGYVTDHRATERAEIIECIARTRVPVGKRGVLNEIRLSDCVTKLILTAGERRWTDPRGPIVALDAHVSLGYPECTDSALIERGVQCSRELAAACEHFVAIDIL